MNRTLKTFIASVLAATAIFAGTGANAADWEIRGNLELLSEEDKKGEAVPDDVLYEYTVIYSTDKHPNAASANLYYLNRLKEKLSDAVEDTAEQSEEIRFTSTGNAVIKLYKNGTFLKSYTDESGKDAYATELNYKLVFNAEKSSNGYGASVLILSEDEINALNPDGKTSISADKFFSISDVSLGESDRVHMKTDTVCKYYIDAPADGWYGLEAVRGSDSLAYLNVSANGTDMEWDVNNSRGNIWLCKGKNTLSITCERGECVLLTFNFNKYECKYTYDKTANYIYVNGTTEPGATVSAVLAESGGIASDGIKAVAQTTADENGNFGTEFKLTAELDGLNLSVNAGGNFWRLDAPNVIESGIAPSGTLTLEKNGAEVNAEAVINNTIRGNYNECHIILAFYGENGDLAEVKLSENYAETFSCDIPQDAAYAKAFLWEYAGGARPFASDVQVKLKN